jgi:hypothetical protein
MAKVWGLDVPLEFSDGFNKFLKLNWQNQIQRVTIADSKPALARSSHIAGRSFIPDFIDDWQSLTEAQQTKWLKDWGDGSQQAFALFFQNNYYRQINALQVRTTPNFFTAPAGWLHIAAGDTSVILRFDILSGDYILSDPANILHLQNRQVCEFEAAYTISATIKAKLKNIATPGTAQCQATIIQYYTDNTGDHSRQEVMDAKAMSDAVLEYAIEHTFTQDDPSEVITGFRIDFEFSDAVGDIWFYEGSITAVDDELGVVRLHNVTNFQDVEKIFAGHLAAVKNQWSLNGEGAGTTLRRVFPYAFGYPEESENPELIKNGDFSDGQNFWEIIFGTGFSVINEKAHFNGSPSQVMQYVSWNEPDRFRLEFDVYNSNGGGFAMGGGEVCDTDIEAGMNLEDGHYSFEGSGDVEGYDYFTLNAINLGNGYFAGDLDNISLKKI